ncbi:MAG: histidine kinase dimerization/phospho-acceptor domain-containing protein [Bdellovibrionota bacterium]
MSKDDVQSPEKPAKRRREDSVENERFRSNLLAIVSHELNTPLTAILNATTMLEERFTAEKEYIPMLRRNAERLRKTVENLLEISRVDAGTLKVRLSELDLGNFLQSRKEALREMLAKSGFSLETEVEEDLPHVCGDFRRLAHVFDSLVLNAVKFSQSAPSGGAAKVNVTLTLEPISSLQPGLRAGAGKEAKTGMFFVVSVQSSLPSIGESPETFEQLFEPFSPWRDADTRVREGLGVELAIDKEILLAHEGFIWADLHPPKPGSGWKFFFALPLLSRVDELDLVVDNRLSTAIGALAKLTLLLIRPEPGVGMGEDESPLVFKSLQRALFRSSDSTFWLQDSGEFVVLMDDCDREGGERVAQRLLRTLHEEFPRLRFLWSAVTGPELGTSARELLENARMGWKPAD